MLLRRKNINIFMIRSCGNGKPGICDKGVRLFPFWKFILGTHYIILQRTEYVNNTDGFCA